MAQFHAVFFIWSSCQLCLYSHQHIYQQLRAFSNTRLAPTENTTIWNLKLSLSSQLCRVGWCEPCGLCCGALTGGAPWWQHSCQRHWPPQVLLVTSVSLSAPSMALVNNIQLSPHLCSPPGQELRDTGSICAQLSLPCLQGTVSRGHQSLRRGCPWLQGLFGWAAVTPYWILLLELPTRMSCVKVVPTSCCTHNRNPGEAVTGSQFIAGRQPQTLLFLSLNWTAYKALMPECFQRPFVFKHSKCAFCSPHPLAFPLTIWPMVSVNFYTETSPITADCCNVQTGSMVNSWSC